MNQFILHEGHFNTIQLRPIRKSLDKLAEFWNTRDHKPSTLPVYKKDYDALMRRVSDLAKLQGMGAPNSLAYRGFELKSVTH